MNLTREFPAIESRSDPESILTYGNDWANLGTPRSPGVLFPRSTDEVVQIIQTCFHKKYSVVTSGGRTGLSGGAAAFQNEIILSLSKMNRIGTVSKTSLTVEVEAGAITQAVHETTRPFGLTWPVDFASKGSSTVGGNLATNAGGIRVIRYGSTRNWVLGLTMVDGTGSRHSLNGALEKNNTGLDLKNLLIGSEGIFGVITEATLKLARVPKTRWLGLFHVDSLKEVLNQFELLRSTGITISAFEAIGASCYTKVIQHLRLSPPFPTSSVSSHHYLMLVEIESSTQGQIDSWLESALSSHGILNSAVSETSQSEHLFWAIREGIAEAVLSTGIAYQHDVSVPIKNLVALAQEIETIYKTHVPEFKIYVFGHIGDGNLHIFISPTTTLTESEFISRCHEVDPYLFSAIQSLQGTVSAEHGIGIHKKSALPYSKTENEIQILKSLKRIFDPAHILNPGKVIN